MESLRANGRIYQRGVGCPSADTNAAIVNELADVRVAIVDAGSMQ